MSRLIDADAIKEKIDDIWDGRPLSFLGARILAMIDEAPTIDADRPQGEWVEIPHPLAIGAYKCNLCGGYMGYKSNYCPNCGARMKGADDD